MIIVAKIINVNIKETKKKGAYNEGNTDAGKVNLYTD